MEDSREILPSRHNRTNAHVNSQGLVAHTGPAQVQAGWLPD